MPIDMLPSRAARTDSAVALDSPLLHRKRDDRRLSKSIETLGSGDPDCAFTVLEQGVHKVARQTIVVGKHACFALVRMHEPMIVCAADRQSTVAIAKDRSSSESKGHAMNLRETGAVYRGHGIIGLEDRASNAKFLSPLLPTGCRRYPHTSKTCVLNPPSRHNRWCFRRESHKAFPWNPKKPPAHTVPSRSCRSVRIVRRPSAGYSSQLTVLPTHQPVERPSRAFRRVPSGRLQSRRSEVAAQAAEATAPPERRRSELHLAIARSEPEITVRRLSDCEDRPLQESVAIGPCGMRVLTYIQRRIQRKSMGTPEQHVNRTKRNECARPLFELRPSSS